ncbi:MAG: hypothetical protein M3H12_12365 [Chromatiales bacterium]
MLFEKLASRPSAWQDKLACRVVLVMLGLRAATNLDTGVSPSIMVTDQQPALLDQLVVQQANFRVVHRWGKCFRIRFEHKDDNVFVDRLRPFYEMDTNCQTRQVTDTTDCKITNGERSGGHSKPTRTVPKPSRLGIGLVN